LKKTLVLFLLLSPLWVGALRAADPGQGTLLAQAPNGGQKPDQNQGSQNIGDDDIQPKEPYMATVFSIMPGIIFHGSGNFYAEDYQFGTEMLVMEIFGGGFALWGYNVIHEPQHWGQYFGNETSQAGYWIKAAGVGLLAISWVGDVATAPGAADSWNKEHQLEFQMDSFNATGLRLTMTTKF